MILVLMYGLSVAILIMSVFWLLSTTRSGMEYRSMIFAVITIIVMGPVVTSLMASEPQTVEATMEVVWVLLIVLNIHVLMFATAHRLCERPYFKFRDMFFPAVTILDGDAVIVTDWKKTRIRRAVVTKSYSNGVVKRCLERIVETGIYSHGNLPLKYILQDTEKSSAKETLQMLRDSYRWELAQILSTDEFNSFMTSEYPASILSDLKKSVFKTDSKKEDVIVCRD